MEKPSEDINRSETPKGNEGLELSSEEQEKAKEVSEALEETGRELENLDPNSVSREELQALDGKIDVVMGILVAFVGYKIAKWGFGGSDMAWYMEPGLERLIETLKGMASAVIGAGGATVVLGGLSVFWGGLEKYAKNVKKVKESISGKYNESESQSADR